MDKIIHSAVLIAESSGISTGRLVPTVAAVVGMIGVVFGGLALARCSSRLSRSKGRPPAIAAGVAGLISVMVGGLHWANSAGGFGSGNGRAGAIVAVAVGLVAMVLGGLAFTLSHRLKPDC